MTSSESDGSKSINWTRDTSTLDRFAEISRRRFGEEYVPQYKTGRAWLNDFLNKPETERVQEYQFKPDNRLLEIGLENTIATPLGTIYDRILYETDKGQVGGSVSLSDDDLSRVDHIREFLIKALGRVQENLAQLQSDPKWKHEVTLRSFSALTSQEAIQMLRKDVSGYDLKWHLTRAEDIETQVKRAAFLSALGFPLRRDNMISTGPNFAARIATKDVKTKRIMYLHWGWGNPHIFYGVDITQSEGSVPTVTLTDKIIVVSAYEIAKSFIFIGSFPQDMIYCRPLAA